MSKRVALTDVKVRNLKARPSERFEVADTACPGLVLRVSNRTKKWVFRHQKDGKRERLPLGTYPDVPLAKAREKAEAIRTGEAPEPETEPAPPTAGGTIWDMIDEYVTHSETYHSEEHAAKVRVQLRDGRHAFLAFLKKEHDPHMPAAAVTSDMVKDWLARAYKRCPPSVRHYRTALLTAFNWAMAADYDYRRPDLTKKYAIAANPVAVTPRAPGHAPRTVLIPPGALATFWDALPEHADPVMGQLIRMVIAMLGIRVMEAARIEKTWVREDEGVMWINWPKTKNGHAHALPMPDAAEDIYKTALALSPKRSPLLFPSPHDIEQPFTATAISKAVRLVRERSGITHPFVLKDWRRTVTSKVIEERWVPERAIDIWHNHGQNADVARKHYTHSEFRAIKLETAGTLEAFLERYLGAGRKGRKAA